jgi:hypothetical protein
MLTRSELVAVVLVIGLVLGISPLAFTQERRPPLTRAGLHQIHAAAKALEQAKRHLERAEHKFGGHRAKALDLVKQAEEEVKQAVAFAKANPPAAPPAAGATTSAPAAKP